MKNIYLTLLSIIFQLAITTAQDRTATVPEYGKVDIAELQLQDCSFSPGAPAINLLKYREIELSVFPNGNTEVVTLTRFRIKIFDKKGYKNATITIPFSSDNTIKIKNIQAATYNLDENGQVKITSITEDDIFKIEGTKKDRFKSIKFTFPDIKEGSVIEYQFTRKYKMAYDVPSWYFQDDIPNLLTVYKVSRPTFSHLQKRVITDLPIEETHVVDESKGIDKKQLLDTYIMRNVPAFKSEAFMSSSRDYKYCIDFLVDGTDSHLSLKGWYSANSLLLGLPSFGGVFNSKIPGTKNFVDSVKQLSTVPEKIRSVYRFVKQKVKWVHVYYKFARDLDEVWKEGEGTSAEINLSILNLLRKCGVQCFPVLYSTRWNGKVDYTFPDLSQFNTVNIAVVNGKKFDLLDGTNPYLSYETPPFNVVNRTGMLIDPVHHTKLNIDFDRKLVWDSIFASASVTSNGVLKGRVIRRYFDLAKSMKLQNAEEANDDEKSILPTEAEIMVDSTWQVNVENELLPLIEYSTFHYEIPTTNDFYFLNPFLFSNLTVNPFTDSERISDVDFGASTASAVQIEIVLPKDVRVEELPKNKEIYTPDSSILFVYHNEIRGDTIKISSSIEIKKPIFSKQEYAALKITFEKIYSQLNNQIVLRKKDEN
jgi:hypothetical protein